MVFSRDPRHLLIKEVWPDKLLYGTMLIVVSSLMGFFHGLLVLGTDLPVAARFAFIEAYPVELTVALSLVAFVLALVAWRRLSVGIALLASLAGIASLSLFGVGTLHAAAALVFLGLARFEQEDKTPPKDRVDKWQWPDKALAASMLLLLAATMSVAFGVAVMLDQVNFGGVDRLQWGVAQLVAGIVALVAADLLYRQRAPAFGVFACLLCVVTLGGYVVSPGLAVGALVAIALAWREQEFSGVPLEGLAGPTREQKEPRAKSR